MNITIHLSELLIINTEWYLNPEQTILKLLKEKGAPVLGVLYFTLDPAYDYSVLRTPLGDHTYTFKLKDRSHSLSLVYRP